jgi:hypothetical protein
MLERDVKVADISSLSNGLINPEEATYVIHHGESQKDVPKNYIFAMSQAEYDKAEFWPPLKGYNKERIRREFPWKKYLVVRPDRYTFGTAQTVDGLQEVARRAKEVLFGPSG